MVELRSRSSFFCVVIFLAGGVSDVSNHVRIIGRAAKLDECNCRVNKIVDD